jgi:hypothetical protein
VTGVPEVVSVPLSALEPWPGNARTHDLATIRESLRENTQYRPVLVQASSGRIIAGHGTVEAAAAEGWQAVDVIYLDVDDDRAGRINLVDNRANDLAGYDTSLLLAQLSDLGQDWAGTGYDDDAIELLRSALLADDGGPTTRGERLEGADAADLRSLVLPYPAATFDQVVEALGRVRRALDLETNADVVHTLLLQALQDVTTDEG